MTCTFNAGPSFAGSWVDVELRLVSLGCVDTPAEFGEVLWWGFWAIAATPTAARSASPSGSHAIARAGAWVWRWRAVCCSGAGGACAGRWPPRWWLRACVHASSASCPPPPSSGHVVLFGDVELLGRAVGVADRQLIGLASGDLGLVEVRNVHCDRLGAHRDSFLGRSAIGSRAAPFRP
jgi:hypothetical protein